MPSAKAPKIRKAVVVKKAPKSIQIHSYPSCHYFALTESILVFLLTYALL
jgi:hypothetical protein